MSNDLPKSSHFFTRLPMTEYAVIVKVENSVQSHCWSVILHDRGASAVLYTREEQLRDGLGQLVSAVYTLWDTRVWPQLCVRV